jgi:hypothetical protein
LLDKSPAATNRAMLAASWRVVIIKINVPPRRATASQCTAISGLSGYS